ncbi:MAG: preprotein translocase subunit SecE [Solirubrobacterales bacterium]|nr:preprotein translocase subunit SecE [Solirubrobacterales bacterium]
MARNRKRAKERRPRQAQPVASGRGRDDRLLPGDPEQTATGFKHGDDVLSGEAPQELIQDSSGQFEDGSGDGAPNPLEHATPDVELAEERVALGSVEAGSGPVTDEELIEAEEAEAGELEDGLFTEPAVGGRAEAPAPIPHAAVAAPRPWLGARLLAFLEGSWRELQRVQWPDRRQVMQATGVVIGFVIVASVFLGVADLVAGKIVHFVLNGTF